MAAVGEMLLGISGIIGVLMRFIGPLTIAPTVSLVGIALYPPISEACQHHWGIAVM